MRVQVRPVAHSIVVQRAGVDPPVVADVQLAVRDDGGVLVGVRLLVVTGALERRVREALETEVPVWRDRRPVGATLLRLIDLLETEVEVILVGGIDGEELVVPFATFGLARLTSRTIGTV
jgi:hypothetical protein